MFNICKHKYGKVEGKFQYCTKCGKAIAVPEAVCNHTYGSQRVLNVRSGFYGTIQSIKYVDVCTKCGNVRVQIVNS